MTPVRTERNARRRNPRRPWTRGTVGRPLQKATVRTRNPASYPDQFVPAASSACTDTERGPGRAANRRVDPTRPIGRTSAPAAPLRAPEAGPAAYCANIARPHTQILTLARSPSPANGRQDSSLLLHVLCIPGCHRCAGSCAGTTSVPHPRGPAPGLQPGPAPCAAAENPAKRPRTLDAKHFSQPERSN